MSSALTTCQLPSHVDLSAMFAPRSVALIGATDREGSVGRALLENLRSFPGDVYPVNPKRSEVLGLKAYASLAAIEGHVDLAVIVTPAPSVPALIGECVTKGVKAVIIISKKSDPKARHSKAKSWLKRGATACASSGQTASA